MLFFFYVCIGCCILAYLFISFFCIVHSQKKSVPFFIHKFWTISYHGFTHFSSFSFQMQDGRPIPKRVHTVVISTQHSEDITQEEIKKQLMEHVIKPVIPGKTYQTMTVCLRVCFFCCLLILYFASIKVSHTYTFRSTSPHTSFPFLLYFSHHF